MAKKIEADVPWDLITPELIKAFTPFIQAIAWIGLSKVNPKVNAMNNLIAIAEIVPAVDLGLPKGIVLGAMYDKTEDALEMINQITQAIEELPASLKKFIQETTEKAKEEAEEIIPGTEESREFWTDIINLFRPSTWESVKEFGK